MTNSNEPGKIRFMKMKKLSETLRTEIETCGISRYKIAQETGIDAAVLCRFLQGGSLKIETAERLLEFFKIDLVKRGRK